MSRSFLFSILAFFVGSGLFTADLVYAQAVAGQRLQPAPVDRSDLLLAPATSKLQSFCPTDSAHWSKIHPQQIGADVASLNQAMQLAGRSDSNAVVVLWRGHIVAEHYWKKWNRDTAGPMFSASKGFVSTLFGIALDEGKIQRLDVQAAHYVDQWKNKKEYENITVEHLLTMTSGLESGRGIFARGIIARNEERFATRLSVDHSPGCYWDYQNSAYRLLFSILERITGQSLPEYSKEKLFDPLGMEHAHWAHKRLAPNQYTHLDVSALDAARFGLLIQRKGDWNGRQIVSKEWIERATQPFAPEVNDSYGYLWWLNSGNAYRLPMRRAQHTGSLFPDCPVDTIAALGAKGQKIYIVPSLELVVVRMGEATTRNSVVLDRFDDQFLGGICAAFGFEKQ